MNSHSCAVNPNIHIYVCMNFYETILTYGQKSMNMNEHVVIPALPDERAVCTIGHKTLEVGWIVGWSHQQSLPGSVIIVQLKGFTYKCIRLQPVVVVYWC